MFRLFGGAKNDKAEVDEEGQVKTHHPIRPDAGFTSIMVEDGRPIFSKDQVLSPKGLQRGVVLFDHSTQRMEQPVVILEGPRFDEGTKKAGPKITVRYIGYGRHEAEAYLVDYSVIPYADGFWSLHHFYTTTGEVMTEEELAELDL